MTDATYTGYGIKLHWGSGGIQPLTGDSGKRDRIGFSERAYRRWKCKLPVGTCMLLYETGKNRGAKAINAEVRVCGTFAEGERLREQNPEHSRMLPVRTLLSEKDVTPVPLARVREILGEPKWPRQGLSWWPVTCEVYETLRTELLCPGERKTT